MILTDATSDGERLAFVFDTTWVRVSGLACELVIPDRELEAARATKDPAKLQEQFARTPYAVAFWSRGITFVLVTVHIKWGTEPERTPEITALASWLKRMAADLNGYGHNLFTLGDFNIEALTQLRPSPTCRATLLRRERLPGFPRVQYTMTQYTKM